MKILFYSMVSCCAGIVISGCALIDGPLTGKNQFLADWNSKMIKYQTAQAKLVMDDPLYSDFERESMIKKLVSALPENTQGNGALSTNGLNKLLSDIKLRRTANFKSLYQALADLKPFESISEADAEDALENGKKLMRQLNDFRDFKEYPAAAAKLNAWLLSLFCARPQLVISADKAFSSFPSDTNQQILAAAFTGKAAALKKSFRTIWQNYESVRNANAKFALFLKSPDDAHWNAFKTQVSRIGYSENDPVRRRYGAYIWEVDHCRRIFFTLKYWELADTGFIDWVKGDVGIRIWSGQHWPFFRQIAVENADRNWHSDPSFSSKGNQKKISHPLIARSNNDIIRMVSIHFQNSSGRTVESPVFEYSIYQLAALTYKTGTGELKLEGSPVNHAPGPRKGLVVITIKDMPKLETFSD